MPKSDYDYIIKKYSEEQLNKAHDILSDMLECAETATKEEGNFAKDVEAIKSVQKIVEDCINYGA